MAALNPAAVQAARQVVCHGAWQVVDAIAELAVFAIQERADQIPQMLTSAGARAECVKQVQEDIPPGFGVRDGTVDVAVLAAAQVLADLDAAETPKEK